MPKRILYILLAIILFTSNIFAINQNIEKNNIQLYWYSKVAANVLPPPNCEYINEDNTEHSLFAIEYLLTLEGDSHPAEFSGATHVGANSPNVTCTVEVAALFYISYIFYKNWQHADGVALLAFNKKLNDPETIKKAYSYYREWFALVKVIGIDQARELNIGPLDNKDISWW